ncbi:MAG: YeeE/YedE family protein [Myxococcales bacterium]|nr:YeeE/YedE family protein [Myxococcales bacterium]
MKWVVPFLAGALFAVGLAVAGMTQPAKVVGFLDVAGQWDPSLAFVMASAVAVFAAAFFASRRLSRPLLAPEFATIEQKPIDARLVGGAALFGVGWGLGGYCPGPAVAALGAAVLPALVFVGAMAAGMFVVRRLAK